MNMKVVNYGERFKLIRKDRWKGKGRTVLALAKRLDSPYPATIYNIDRAWRVPRLPTLAKHAAALGCGPWELLEDVETEYDHVRALGILPTQEATSRWRELLARYEQSNERGSQRKQPAKRRHAAASS